MSAINTKESKAVEKSSERMPTKAEMEALFDKRNSLLYWFPIVAKLGIPVPKAFTTSFPNKLGRKLISASEGDKKVWKEIEPYVEEVKKLAKKMGYPVFIRTDMASDKHGWKKSAFVRNEEDMLNAIVRTIEHNEMVGMVGLSYSAIVIREFLELDWKFKAFHGEMPVAKERRYFVKNGKVLCHHPYWIPEAIESAHKNEGKRTIIGYIPHRLPNRWQAMLERINAEFSAEVNLLTGYAERISEAIKGYWSIDFAYTRDGEWYMIDAALGHGSYHYPGCPNKLEAEKI